MKCDNQPFARCIYIPFTYMHTISAYKITLIENSDSACTAVVSFVALKYDLLSFTVHKIKAGIHGM